eukprot:8926058-Pyramimonas_sp.AAC.1
MQIWPADPIQVHAAALALDAAGAALLAHLQGPRTRPSMPLPRASLALFDFGRCQAPFLPLPLFLLLAL